MKLSDINLRDPFILNENGKYYLYGSRAKDFAIKSGGFDCYVSENLEIWSEPVPCFDSEKYNMNSGANWAPEVHKYNGKYYMFATFTKENNLRGVYILTADSPMGPFVPHSKCVTPYEWECLDGTLYIDKKGEPYLVFCHEHTQIIDGTMCYVKLSEDLTCSIGEPVLMFSASSPYYVPKQPEGSHYVTDGPFLYRNKFGRLLLIWSTFVNGQYCQCIAKSENDEIDGHFTHMPPIVTNDGGHGMIFNSNGKIFLTYHTPNSSLNERPVLTELFDTENGVIIKNYKYAEELSKMVKCETVSVTGVENREKFEKFHILLKELFPVVHEKATLEKFGCSLLYKIPGTDNTQKPICLMSHHDVVEATGNWKHPPFSGEIAEGKLWGRGTLDTKGSLWAIMRGMEELLNEGFLPKNDIYIESACTEETDGSGADAITKELQRRGIRFKLVLDEGGMIVHDPLGGCDADFAMIGIGEKAYADIKFVAKSTGGHASTPPKDTPLVRLGKFMAEADKAKIFKVKITKPVEEMFASFAPYSKGMLKFVFYHSHGFRKLLEFAMPKISDTATAMLRTTLAFTQAGGSEGTNVLPQEAFVVGNMRASHHQGLSDSMKKAEKLAKKYNIDMVPLDVGISSGLTSTKSEGYTLVAKAVLEIYENTVVPAPYVMNGASDSRYFDRVSDCCIRFAPFKIDDSQLASIHGIDENLDISTLSKAVEFIKYIVKSN